MNLTRADVRAELTETSEARRGGAEPSTEDEGEVI